MKGQLEIRRDATFPDEERHQVRVCSGFHSAASGPQNFGSRLHERIDTTISVSAGTKISLISFPSFERTGSDIMLPCKRRDRGYIYSENLPTDKPTDGIQPRQSRHRLVYVVQLVAVFFIRFGDFFSDLVLYIPMLTQEIENACKSV